MRSLVSAVALSLGLGAGAAQAVVIGGSYDVNPALGVESFGPATGSYSTNSHSYADIGALGNNWGGVFIDDSAAQRRLNFLGSDPGAGNANVYLEAFFINTILNIPGIDIIAFESGDTPTDAANNPVPANDPTNDEVENLSASLTGAAGTFADFTVLGFLTDAQVGGSATSFGVYVLGLDLGDLGLAEGDFVSSLVFGNSASLLDHDPDIVWGGGVTGAEGPVVPVPAALPLLLSALGMLGLLRRRAAAARA
ncbi:hypothetical protein LNKW23_02790 [Paralimibaculum aggregatum]|uniref:VPLPA-CTERM sorting domain-containing protein n=1 Tax=Paralimibaculum aggregatum TaxID=3036245 RepID=A0ABQ6LHE0_9RHOB|nr:hypothetical protein [Limibaculum sp. NKW23]GMG81067.1 hypothetical protein LNKW23_02790 [Limibaculum sp. NKW23]